MYFGVIKKIRFFDDKDNNLIGSIVPMLSPLKSSQYEYIYKKNSHPASIYFITKGRVSFYLQKKAIAFKDMIEGGYFGDLDIIFARKRRYSMISTAGESEFLILTKQIIEDTIIKEYPEVYEEMSIVALEREKRIKAAKQIALKEYNEML
jgi:CRP-like cAMP-binding protein